MHIHTHIYMDPLTLPRRHHHHVPAPLRQDLLLLPAHETVCALCWSAAVALLKGGVGDRRVILGGGGGELGMLFERRRVHYLKGGVVEGV